VNVEALYEPMQYGDEHGFQIIEDDQEFVIDMVANGLTLE